MNSFWATEQISPLWLNRMHRLEVVPESRAMMYLDMGVIPSVLFFVSKMIARPCGGVLHQQL